MTKLSSFGVKAVRAVPTNTDVFSCALSGDYRFGILLYDACTAVLLIMYVHNLALVFMSPETATTNPWRNLFSKGKIAVVAVDEAHCISEWLVP